MAATEAPDPLEMLIELAPAVAVKVPPQVLVAFGVLATTIPVGNVSVKPRPVRDAVLLLGLVIVMVRVEVPPGKVMVGWVNVFVAVGGPSTFNVAEAVRPVPPLVELTLPVVLV